MLYREIIAVCSEIHTKHINTLCGQNVELLYVKLVVHTVTTGFKCLRKYRLYIYVVHFVHLKIYFWEVVRTSHQTLKSGPWHKNLHSSDVNVFSAAPCWRCSAAKVCTRWATRSGSWCSACWSSTACSTCPSSRAWNPQVRSVDSQC